MGPENFAPIRPTVQKLRHFFEVTDTRTHGRTDGHTDKNESPQYHYRIFFFLHICEGEGGKLYKPYEISTSSLREWMKMEEYFDHFKKQSKNLNSSLGYIS